MWRFASEPKPIDALVAQMMRGSGAAPRITRDQALSVAAVQKARNMVCSIGTLPLVQIGPDGATVRNPLLEQLDPDVPNVVTVSQTVEDLFLYAIAWWRVIERNDAGFPKSVRRLDPSAVSLNPPSGVRAPSPLPGGYDPRDATVWVDGRAVPARDMIRFDSPNPAVLAVAGRAVLKAIRLEEAALKYAEDPKMGEYFTPRDGVDEMPDDEVRAKIALWRALRRESGTGYVPRALEYHEVATPNPRELQLVELSRQAGLEIANAFGVDPEELGISTTSRTYSNAIDRRRDRINDTLAPYMRAITDRLSMGDVTPRGHRVQFDLDDYMKANPTERWNVYKTAWDIGAITRKEIRAKEGLPPMDIPDSPVSAVPAPPTPARADASRPATLTFSSERTLTFVDVPTQTFSVDRDRRVIEGLALPWGQVGNKFGLQFRFARGALQWSDPRRVKLLRDHDPKQPLGYAEKLTNTATGLQVRFKVARGADGDRALELAEDGVLDGLSVGVEFDMGTDTHQDRRDPAVTVVRRATLREVSLTAMPAYDDARVTKVAASHTDGGNMECPHCGQVHAPGVQCPTQAAAAQDNNGQTATNTTTQAQASAPAGVTLDTAAVAALLAALAANNAHSQAHPKAQAHPQTPTLDFVNPVRPVPTAVATVREPDPYRFDRDGNLMPGSHDFSSDLVAAYRGDTGAYDRAMTFVREAFTSGRALASARAQFDVATPDVAALNPARQRPDLYVDQLDFVTPLYDRLNKGTLSDVTPFTLPKFVSSSNLVNDHTEGTEPTSGSLQTTTQTITPTPLSGKVKIRREAWDQGGNPQLSVILWRQITREWFEELESAIGAFLDSLTPTNTVTIPAGAQDAALDEALTGAFADLHFQRGGHRYRDFFLQADLYKAITQAVDTTGRKLYPVLGPTNAVGTTAADFGSVAIGGAIGRPTWALGPSGSAAESSYLINPDDAHVWASAPQRLQFDIEVANVYVGVWGYKALAVTRLEGVREFVYDPVP